MLWDTIIGQHYAVAILKRSIQEKRLSSAYLFFGPEGVGKTTTARIVAKAVNCPDQGCDQCRVCVRINEKNYPEVKEISAEDSTPVTKKSTASKGGSIKIEQIREINKELSLGIFEAQYRVYILKEVEKMTAPAANAFLKILEEPPKNTIFILTTNAVDSLFSTIVSRCQLVRFNLLSSQEVEEVLKKHKKGIKQEGVSFLTSISAGRPGKAIEYMEKKVGKYVPMVQGYLEEIFEKKNEVKIFEFAEKIKASSEDAGIILDIIIQMISISKHFPAERNYQARDEIMKIKDQRTRNINLQLGLEVMLFRLTSLKSR